MSQNEVNVPIAPPCWRAGSVDHDQRQRREQQRQPGPHHQPAGDRDARFGAIATSSSPTASTSAGPERHPPRPEPVRPVAEQQPHPDVRDPVRVEGPRSPPAIPLGRPGAARRTRPARRSPARPATARSARDDRGRGHDAPAGRPPALGRRRGRRVAASPDQRAMSHGGTPTPPGSRSPAAHRPTSAPSVMPSHIADPVQADHPAAPGRRAESRPARPRRRCRPRPRRCPCSTRTATSDGHVQRAEVEAPAAAQVSVPATSTGL